MSVVYTQHAFERINERGFEHRKDVLEKARLAHRYGKYWYQLKGPLSNYVKSKGNLKMVKYYDGYIFVFTKTSKRLITMYPVRDDVILEQLDYEERRGNE